jgi:hypothetical protein
LAVFLLFGWYEKGRSAEGGKRLLLLRGWGSFVFCWLLPSRCGAKIGVWPLDASPDQESAALGPPQYLCRSNLLPRLRLLPCKIFDSLPSTALLLPVVFFTITPAANLRGKSPSQAGADMLNHFRIRVPFR